jgi:hypothetical protein
VPDRPVPDIISGGRDPDRRSKVPWRLVVAAAAVVLVAAGIAIQLSAGGSGHPPRHRAHRSLSVAALTAPSMLHGTALRAGAVPAASLFLGGNDLRLLRVPGRGRPAVTNLSPGSGPGSGAPNGPLGPGPAVQQISAVAGGVVALISSHGEGGLPDVGDVVFVPSAGSSASGSGTTGAGAPRVIARANYMAVAPNHRDIWVEQAGPPWGNGPASSPAWLVDEAGHRLPAARGVPARHLGDRLLVAATVRGLLVRGSAGKMALVDPATGRAAPAGIPPNSVLAGADADQVAWQATSCKRRCPLRVTDLRDGRDTAITLPPHTAVEPSDTADFDPAGQHLALPLDTVAGHGANTGTQVYIADLRTGRLAGVPGGTIPVVTLPAVLGAFPAGSAEVVSARWTASGAASAAGGEQGLWIVATDGLFFQAGYWAGNGPLQVLPPQDGLAYKFGLPGVAPGQ